MFFFFFSSRRRHTRSLRDWSSDVCSSDLGLEGAPLWCGRDSGEVCGAVAGGSEVEVEEKQSLVGAEHVVEGHVTMAVAGGVAGVLREVVPYRGRQCPEQ